MAPHRPPSLNRRRLLRFALVGITGSVAYYLLVLLMVEGLHTSVMTGTSIAFVVVVLQNYFLHYAWTFSSTAMHVKALPQFFLMSATGFGINWATMFAGVEWLKFNYLLVQVAAIGAVVAWNVLITHFVIFREDLVAWRGDSAKGSTGRPPQPAEAAQDSSSPS